MLDRVKSPCWTGSTHPAGPGQLTLLDWTNSPCWTGSTHPAGPGQLTLLDRVNSPCWTESTHPAGPGQLTLLDQVNSPCWTRSTHPAGPGQRWSPARRREPRFGRCVWPLTSLPVCRRSADTGRHRSESSPRDSCRRTGVPAAAGAGAPRSPPASDRRSTAASCS